MHMSGMCLDMVNSVVMGAIKALNRTHEQAIVSGWTQGFVEPHGNSLPQCTNYLNQSLFSFLVPSVSAHATMIGSNWSVPIVDADDFVFSPNLATGNVVTMTEGTSQTLSFSLEANLPAPPTTTLVPNSPRVGLSGDSVVLSSVLRGDAGSYVLTRTSEGSFTFIRSVNFSLVVECKWLCCFSHWYAGRLCIEFV